MTTSITSGAPVTRCPVWCDGRHDLLYDCGGEVEGRSHFREIGRLAWRGDSQLLVGVSAEDGDEGLRVELIHLGLDGEPFPELLGGAVCLTADEALMLAPLVTRAADVIREAEERDETRDAREERT